MRAVSSASAKVTGARAPERFAQDRAAGLRRGRSPHPSKHALRRLGLERPRAVGQGRILSDAELFELAKSERGRAQAKVSGFKVGAAAISASGHVFSAHNLEVSDRLAIGTCAETSIAFQLREQTLRTLLITSDSERCIAPCGACRQTLTEVAPKDARVVMTSSTGEKVETTVGALLPMPAALPELSPVLPYLEAIDRAKLLYDKADTGGRDIARHGAVLLDADGTMHGGATRKQSGTMTLAVQMAADARFLTGAAGSPKAAVIVGVGGGVSGLPVPTGRERQELFNLGSELPVILLNPETGATALTTAAALLPFAYTR